MKKFFPIVFGVVIVILLAMSLLLVSTPKYLKKQLPPPSPPVAEMQPKPAPVPAPTDLSEIVENELKKLSPGRFLFNVPQEMKVGVKERVEARIAKNFTEDLSIGLRGHGVPLIEEIKVNTLMGVRLNGRNFDIKALSHEEQIVTGEGFTQWDWDVVPLKSGDQLLSLVVTVRIKIPDYGEERKDYPVFDRQIKVKVNPVYTIKTFIESYWQWIIVTILIPLIGWVVKKLWKSRKEE